MILTSRGQSKSRNLLNSPEAPKAAAAPKKRRRHAAAPNKRSRPSPADDPDLTDDDPDLFNL